MIFDSIVSSAGHLVSNIGPLVSINNMQHIKHPLFCISPGFFYYIWRQVIVPSFSALFSDPVAQHGSYLGPSAGTVFFNQFPKFHVLFFIPSLFFAGHQFTFEHWGLKALTKGFVVYIHYKNLSVII